MLPVNDEALAAYVASVEEIVTREREAERIVPAVRDALEALLAREGWRLPDAYRTPHPEAPYSRNLVHQDAKGRFSVIALVWNPFVQTAVHDHLNWCVVGMLEGRCLAVDYERVEDATAAGEGPALRATGASILQPAATVGLLPPPRRNIHQMSCATHEGAISLHTYGDPGRRARIYLPAERGIEVRELEFHNR